MKLLRDTWLVFGRYFGIFIHNPVWVALGVLQPLLYLILFAPLLKPIAAMRGFPPGGAYNVFVPGLLVQLGMFGAAGVGFSLISELRMGVIERLRVTPVSRVALLFGRALRDMFSIVLQSLILILIALPFGLSIHPLGVVVVLALIGLIGLLTASIAYAVALAVKSEDSYAPIVFTSTLPILLLSGVLLLIGLIGLLTASIAYAVALAVKSEDSYAPIVFTSALPILLLSGVLLPMSIAPQWLQNIAHVNPLLYAVDAARAIFNDHLGDPSVAQGVLILLVLSIVAVVIGARQFGRAVA